MYDGSYQIYECIMNVSGYIETTIVVAQMVEQRTLGSRVRVLLVPV